MWRVIVYRSNADFCRGQGGVVLYSGDADGARRCHTWDQLRPGEYLVLVNPDGRTVACRSAAPAV